MPTCRVCKQHVGFSESASLLRWEHKACKQQRLDDERRAREAFAQLERQALEAALDSNALEPFAAALAESPLSAGMRENLLVRAFEIAANQALDDGLLTQAEEESLKTYRKRFHLQAELSRTRAWGRIRQGASERLERQALEAALDFDALEPLATALAESPLSQTERGQLLTGAFDEAVERALGDGLLTRAEEESLGEYRRRFDLSQGDLDHNHAWTRTAQAAILRDVMDGQVPQRVTYDGHIPFNLMKSEDLVWLEQDARYYQLVTRREFRGSSQGVSIRIANGVYYRPSAFKGRSVTREETVHRDTGLLGLTTKHIYFHGERERFRVRYDRIVSFEPFDDGIGIMRDNQRAKPETFTTGDGWFIYNLATNLSQM